MNFVIKGDSVEKLKLTENSTIKWGITHKNGALNYSMRYIEVEAGGSTPDHSHFYEHEIFIIDGSGKILIDGKEESFEAGDFIFIPGGKKHTIKADKKLKMICVVPIEAAKMLLGD